MAWCTNNSCSFMCISLNVMSVYMKQQFDDNYINIEEAVKYLGIKPVTLRN